MLFKIYFPPCLLFFHHSRFRERFSLFNVQKCSQFDIIFLFYSTSSEEKKYNKATHSALSRNSTLYTLFIHPQTIYSLFIILFYFVCSICSFCALWMFPMPKNGGESGWLWMCVLVEKRQHEWNECNRHFMYFTHFDFPSPTNQPTSKPHTQSSHIFFACFLSCYMPYSSIFWLVLLPPHTTNTFS